MNVDKFLAIRLQNDTIKEVVMEHKKKIVNNCKTCKGSGFISGGRYCSCMKEFLDIKSVVVSGAPLEALDVRSLVKDGRKMVDPKCKRVVLSTDQHGIYDINRQKSLYKDIIKPYLFYAEEGAFKRGESLMLFGRNSRGKTWALYFILIWLSRVHKYSILYYSLKELFTILNDAYFGSDNTSEGALHRDGALRALHLIKDVDMLLIDEGSKLPKFSDHVRVQLEGLVKERISNRKPIVMATNHTPEDFYRMFGPSVVSAFIKNVYPIHIMEGPDLRANAMEKGTAFSYL